MASLPFSQLEALWTMAGGQPGDAPTAAAVALAESGGDPSRINNTAYPKLPGYRPVAPGNLPEYSVGLWQINTLAHPQYSVAALLTPIGNANAATAIERARGNFTDWSTFKNGTYEKYVAGVPAPTPQPGPEAPAPSGPETAHAFAGWNDLQNSVNRHLPRQLRKSQMMGETALKVLARKHKVGR